MEAKGEVTFACKYCKVRTAHKLKERTEYKGKQVTIVVCMVCNYKKLMYRDPKTGKLIIDETDVPKRTIIMPHDIEHRQTQLETEEEVEHSRSIDEWLKSDKLRIAYDKKIKGRK